MPRNTSRRTRRTAALQEISQTDADLDRQAAAAGAKRPRERPQTSGSEQDADTTTGSGAEGGRRTTRASAGTDSASTAATGASSSLESRSTLPVTSGARLSSADTNAGEERATKRARVAKKSEAASSGPGAEGSVSTSASMKPSLPAGVIDIDEMMEGKEAHVSAYAADIYESYKTIDTQHRISTNYMETVQSDVDPGMRAILVDWLVEVIEEYRLMPETLYIAVQYVDRYLTHVPISRARLQLLGCAAMLLASKYEEIYAPSVNEFCYISNNTYTREEIIAMERRVAEQLGYRLRCSTPKTFMARYLRAAFAKRGDMVTNLTKYLTELTLQEYRFLKYRPSEVSAAVVLTARRTAKHNVPSLFAADEAIWTPTLAHYTGYTEAELEECSSDVAQCHRDASGIALRAIYEKYSHSPYSRVSKAVRPLSGDAKVKAEPAQSCAGHLKGNTY